MPETPTETPAATEAPAESESSSSGSEPRVSRDGNGGATAAAKSYATNTSAARNISLAMFFAAGFALLGHEIGGAKNPKGTNGITEGGRILLGGFAGGTILIAVSKLGEGAAEFAQGLALVTAASSVLVFGAPVWGAIGGLFGTSKPTKNTVGVGLTPAPDTGTNPPLPAGQITPSVLGTPTTGST